MATHGEDLSQLDRALQALRQMRARLDAAVAARHEPIAVVGVGCRFPGGADSPDAFWRLLVEGVDAVTEIPPDRWDADALFSADVDAPGRMATRWGAFLERVDEFDPAFFGIAPREAASMDPQQRLLLETSWEALERAGQPRERLAGSATGVFVGAHSHSSDYGTLQLVEREAIGTYTSTGTAHSILANRLSYWLDLRGPSLTVDTACSSSLVAAHLAVQSLRAGECDLALAAGVNLLLAPEVTIALSRMRMMAGDGRCKTFDASADGFVRGEGCGVIVLKRLADAERDGDPVLALIAGSATNQDGATNGLTAPSGLAQREVVRRALADARVEPARIGYVETHGTGTALGDPIEVDALADVLGRAGDLPCLLGAVKTNLGHLEGAAGIAGLIKAVLALHHGVVPPNLHFREPNPHLPLAGTRFEIPTAPRAWPADVERWAGVSSFGFGGTNAHLVLRAAAARATSSLAHEGGGEFGADDADAHLLPLSAHMPDALRAAARAHAELLAGDSPPPLADVAYTLAVRRTHHEHRLAVVGATADEVARALAAYAAGEAAPEVVAGRADPDSRRRLVFVFSGQGSQWVGMGRELLDEQPVFRASLEACDALFRPLAGWSLVEALTAPAAADRFERTEVAQPLIFAVQVALAALWRAWGVEPDAIVGHSLGEVAAAHVAGVLDLEQAVRVVHHRGRIMRRADGAGRMAAVGLSRAAAEAFLAERDGRVSLAAVNGPSSIVLSGDPEAVESAVAELEARGVFARLLPVSLASHSAQMEPLAAELADVLAGLAPRAAAVPLYSTVTGRAAAPGDFDARYWGRNLREPVLFADAVAAASDADFLEVAPHAILRAPLEQCAGGTGALVTGSLERERPEREALLGVLGALHARGHRVRWEALHPDGGRVVALPNYPWQRQRYWLEPRRAARSSNGGGAPYAYPAAADPFIGRLLTSPAIDGALYELALDADVLAFLGEHRVGNAAVLPASAFVETLLAAGRSLAGGEVDGIEALAIHHPLPLPDGGRRSVQVVLRPLVEGRVAAEVHSRAGEGAGWVLHATATLVVGGGGEGECVAAEGEALIALPRMAPGGAPVVQRAAMFDTGLRLLGELGDEQLGGRVVVSAIERLWAGARAHTAVACRVHADTEAEGRGAVFTGDVHFFDDAGALVAAAEGVRYARLAAAGNGAAAGADGWLYEVVWRRLGTADLGEARGHDLASTDEIVERAAAAGAEAHAADPELLRGLDRLSAAYAARALRGLGVRFEPDERIAADALAVRHRLAPHHRRLVGRLCEWLAEEDVLERAGDGWRVRRAPDDLDPDATAERLAARFAEHHPEVALLRRAAGRLAEVLRGEVDPVELLFGGDAAGEIERFYRDAPLARGPNAQARAALERIVESLPAGRTLRVLEIGAGTGGTTAHLLPVLPPERTEYHFTDVSRAFLERARRRFGEHASMRYALLDIEHAPEAQGFAAGSFDVVVAANVLHATADVRRTLMHVRRLLAPGGVLLLVEGARPTRWVDLVFGQTEGWWRFTDAELRAAHPLLPPERWVELLNVAGFADVRALDPAAADGGSTFPQALIVGRALTRRAETRHPHAARCACTGQRPQAGEGNTAEHSRSSPPLLAWERGTGGQGVTGGAWLIVAEEEDAGRALATAIEARSGVCTLARPGSADARAWADAAPAGMVVYVPAAASVPPDTQADALHARAAAQCAELAALARALDASSAAPKPRLWVVTRGAQPAAGSGDVAAPAHAALWGFAQSLALESAEVWGGILDLADDGDLAAGAAALVARVTAADGEDQAARRGGEWYAPRLVPLAPADPAPPAFRADGAYLITGGLGELGIELARWLAERGAGHLVLTARTPLPPREAWAELPADAPAYPRVAAIREIERLGARVTTAAVDVSDAEAMQRLVARFGAELPPLRGVFHTAAVMGFVPLARLEPGQIEAVLRPKVAGGWLLHRLTRDLALDHFVLFSSVAGLWGSRGMAHYAAANRFLDALAHHRRSLGLPALSVDWGGWEGGDLGRAENRFLAQSDFRLLPADGALDALGAAMSAGVAQRVVASVDWASLRASYELHAPRPFLREIQTAKAEARAATPPPATAAAPATPPDLQQRLAAMTEAEALASLTTHVRDEVAAVLGLDPERLMEPGQGFFKLGMDSLMTVELRARLERGLGLRLPTTIAFEYPTVEALAGFLAAELRQHAPAGAVVAAPPPAPRTTAPAAVPPAELEALSEAELAAMLDGALADLLHDDPTLS